MGVVTVSLGGCRDEERRCYEDEGDWGAAKHALHAALSCRSDFPLLGWFWGEPAGEGRGRCDSPSLSLLSMKVYAAIRAGLPMPPQTPITVVLARFDDLLASGLRELIGSDRSLAIVASDVEHKRISVVLRAHRPDVAILDVGALAKLAEVRELSERYPSTRLVLFADDPSMVVGAQLLSFGASACLGRDTQSRDVLSAIHLASRGLQVTPYAPALNGVIARGKLLTRRESEVLPLLQEGQSNAQIALALQVGVETVRTHARNIYRKLGVSSRRELSAPPVPGPELESASAVWSLRHRDITPLTRLRRGHGLRRS
jgi:DNA-binding NarL/FixJ family response regulator